MKRVGVREFRDHATQYLAGDDVLAVEKHGQPIGFYIPTGKTRQQSFADALARLEDTVKGILAETGMSEDELARLFDLTQQVPGQPDQQPIADSHATGR